MPFPTVTNTFTNATTADATQVNQNFTDLINGISDTTKNISVSAITAAGATTLNGAVTLGTSTANLIVVNGSVNSDIPINTNTTYNIGAATKGLLGVYIGGSSTYTVRLIGGTQAASYTLTLPTAVPAGNAYAIESTTGGVLSFANRRITPTVQTFASGTAQTYTTPAGVLYLKIKMCGGGGGGGSCGTGDANGTTGNSSTFGTSLLTAAGGGAGGSNSGGGIRATGGAATVTSPAIGFGITGGDSCGVSNLLINGAGSNGGCTFFGSSGGGGHSAAAGNNAPANSGGGGGGAAGTGTFGPGTGGGGGASIEAIIPSPSATYTYTVGAAANGAAAGAGGLAGGNGAAGFIAVEEYYQ